MITPRTMGRRVAGRRTLVAGALAAGAVVLVPGTPAVLLAAAGLWLFLGAPAVLMYDVAGRSVSTRDGRLLIAVCLGVVWAMAVALALNTVLPLAGMDRPLTRLPLTLAAAGSLVLLAALSPPADHQGGGAPWWRTLRREPLPAGTAAVLALGVPTVALAVAGAVRLNNGLGSQVSFAALTGVALLVVLLMARHARWSSPVVELGLFLAAVALLLLTSLRGWGLSGHDIQREFVFFRMTSDADRWNVGGYDDPYNACLSVTLLPTALERLTGIPGMYVFKALLPVLFALAVPLVHRSVRNVAPKLLALLSAVFFMAFPAFFSDMTFLARQEVAFVLLGCVMVVLTDTGRPLANRRFMVMALFCGIVISHYSTTYILVTVFALAFAVDIAWRLASRLRRRGARGPVARGFVTLWMVAGMAVATVAWTGPVTHTSDQLHSTVSLTVRDLVGGAAEQGSSDTAYSLFGGHVVSPQQRLDDFRAEAVEDRSERGGLYPMTVVDDYPTPPAEQQNLPLTSAGRAIQDLGVDVSAVNETVRQSVARVLQVLLAVGFVTALVGRRRVFRPQRDQVTLTVGMTVVIAVLTVLPQLSVDYGLLRSFQQGLFFFAPFVAAGMLWIFRWAGRAGPPVACAVTLAIFVDLTGVVPKVLGGYRPQLHLDNAGQYYDMYYAHPEKDAAVGWLEARTVDGPGPGLAPPPPAVPPAPSLVGQVNVQTDGPTSGYGFQRLEDRNRGAVKDDLYPALVERDAYVLLGPTAVRKGEVTVFSRGDLVTYRYPVAFLDAMKDKLYSSEGTEIFR